MHFKSRNCSKNPGFTLAEVAITVVVIGISITALLALEGTLLNNAFKTAQNSEYIIAMKNFFYEAQLKEFVQDDTLHEKVIDDGRVKLTYKVSPINEKSALKKVEDLVSVKIEARWRVGNQEKVDSMITYLYKPQNKPEKTGKPS